MCGNAKALVLKKLEVQFREDFKVLNNYVLELKHSNHGSSVNIVSERHIASDIPVFQKVYVCRALIKEGYIGGCKRLIALDGRFLKGLLKGHLLVVVEKDRNNQMYPVDWAIVKNETSESWT